MDTLLSMRVFCQVVELHSFSQAAARLGMSGAMATKHIKHLESYLDTRLLNRSTRHLSLTEAGASYFERFGKISGLLDDARATIGDTSSVPSGTLRIAAPAWFSSRRFSHVLARYRERYPQVTFDIDLSGRIVNLVDEGYDLALRAAPGKSDSLITRKLGVVPCLLVASPGYLLRMGTPSSTDDLARLGMVSCSLAPDSAPVHLVGATGPASFTPSVVMRANTELLIRDAALDGVGMAALPAWLVEDEVAAGRLVRLLPDRAMAPFTIHAAYTSRKHLSSKVRSFIDFTAADTEVFASPAQDS